MLPSSRTVRGQGSPVGVAQRGFLAGMRHYFRLLAPFAQSRRSHRKRTTAAAEQFDGTEGLDGA